MQEWCPIIRHRTVVSGCLQKRHASSSPKFRSARSSRSSDHGLVSCEKRQPPREWNSFAGLSPSRSRTFVAHLSVPALTRLLTTLTFFSLTQNDHFCSRKGRWKRVRLACAGLLARGGARTLERLEMAAQKSSYFARSTRATSQSERRGTQRGSAFRGQARSRRHASLFQPHPAGQSGRSNPASGHSTDRRNVDIAVRHD